MEIVYESIRGIEIYKDSFTVGLLILLDDNDPNVALNLRGTLAEHIDSIFAFSQVNEAIAKIAQGKAQGKILMTIQEGEKTI